MGKPSQPFSILIGGWVLRLAHKLARHVLQRWKGSACSLSAPDACWVAAFDRRCGPFIEVQDQWASLVSHSPSSLGAGCYGSPTKLARHVLQRWKGSACLLLAPDACWVAAFDRRCGPFIEVQDQWASLVSHSPFSLGAGCYGLPTKLARHVLQRWKCSACLLDACWVAAFDRRCGPFTGCKTSGQA